MVKRSPELLSKQIKMFRLEAKMTAAEVATKLGIQESNYRKYENGSRVPKDSVVRQLASIFGCTVESLYDDGVQNFIYQARLCVFEIVMHEMRFNPKKACLIFDFWAYWGMEHEVGKALQTFFTSEMQETGVAPASNVKGLIDSADHFLFHFPSSAISEFPALCQAGVVFMFNMIQYLNQVGTKDMEDCDVYAEIQETLGLPNLEQAKQYFLLRLFMPFIDFLFNSMLVWQEGVDGIITQIGFQGAVHYHFYRLPLRSNPKYKR